MNSVEIIDMDIYNEKDIYKELKKRNIISGIKPGMKVVVKPNLVCDIHMNGDKGWIDMITNPAIIRAVVRIVVEQLKDSGRISVIDSPIDVANFRRIKKILNLEGLFSECRKKGIQCELIDLRDMYFVRAWGNQHLAKKKLIGDPRGGVLTKLTEEQSAFNGFNYDGVDFHSILVDSEETNDAHKQGYHLYKVSKTCLMADVFINLPKLKCHIKAGITCSLKNLVGINTHKNYLPHYCAGGPTMGGDEFPYTDKKNINNYKVISSAKLLLDRVKILSLLSPIYKKIGGKMFGKSGEVVRAGAWYGNDTLWRMILDLNKVLMYSDSEGNIQNTEQRKYISIVDGIIAGQGNGPMSCEPKKLGKIICGDNPVAVDTVCLKYMRFNINYISHVKNAYQISVLPLIEDNSIEVTENEITKKIEEMDFKQYQKFKIPKCGWEVLMDE